MHKVEISLTNNADLSDYDNQNAKTIAEAQKPLWYSDCIGISTDPHELIISQSDYGCFIDVYKFDSTLESKKILSGITLSGYDENIISTNGRFIKPVAQGQTFVTAEWNNHTVQFVVTVK